MNVFFIAALVSAFISVVSGVIALATRCHHNWQAVKRGDITEHGRYVGYYLISGCEKCHKLKKEKVRI